MPGAPSSFLFLVTIQTGWNKIVKVSQILTNARSFSRGGFPTAWAATLSMKASAVMVYRPGGNVPQT